MSGGPINLEELAKAVQEKMKKNRLTLRKASEASGISFPTLYRIKNAKTVPDTSTLAKLANWLTIPIYKIFKVPFQFEIDDVSIRDTKPLVQTSAIGIHFRGSRKKLKTSPDEFKEVLVKLIRITKQHLSEKT